MTQSVTAVNTDIAFLNRRVRFQVKTTKNEAMPRPIDEIKANCLPGDFFLSRDDRHQKSSQVLLCRMCNEQTQSRAVSLTTRAICFYSNSGEVPLTTLLQVRVVIRIGEKQQEPRVSRKQFYFSSFGTRAVPPNWSEVLQRDFNEWTPFKRQFA